MLFIADGNEDIITVEGKADIKKEKNMFTQKDDPEKRTQSASSMEKGNSDTHDDSQNIQSDKSRKVSKEISSNEFVAEINSVSSKADEKISSENDEKVIKHLMNWDKMKMKAKIIRKIRFFQSKKYEFEENQQVLKLVLFFQ